MASERALWASFVFLLHHGLVAMVATYGRKENSKQKANRFFSSSITPLLVQLEGCIFFFSSYTSKDKMKIAVLIPEIG